MERDAALARSHLRDSSEPHPELVALRTLAMRRVTEDGHFQTAIPELCFLRHSRPTRVVKAPSFGVTLGVVLSGSKTVTVEKQPLHVDPHVLLLITRETEIALAVTAATPAEPYLGLSLQFSAEAVARALVTLSEAGGASGAGENMPAFVAKTDPDVLRALHRLVATLDDPLEREVLAPLATEEILFRLLRSDAAAAVRAAVGAHPDAPRILEAMRFIRTQGHRALTVREIARHVAMSPSHFAHRFRAVARTTPMRYVRDQRLERARSLLSAPGVRVSEIAARVGFPSPPHFTREFKRRFGASPSDYVGKARG